METILNFLPLTPEERAAFEAAAPGAEQLFRPVAATRFSPEAPGEEYARATVILGCAPTGMVAKAGRLRWLQTWSAGVDPYLKEGVAVLAEGRISVRDEKAPQLMCDRVRPLDQVKGNLPPVEGEERAKKLYIRIPSLDDPRWERIKLVLTMFPGTEQMVVKCEDTGKRLGTVCLVHPALIQELNELLGAENVVVR